MRKIYIIVITSTMMFNVAISAPIHYRAEINDRTVLQMVERWHRESKLVTYWDGVSNEKILNVEIFNQQNKLTLSQNIEYSLKQVVSYYNAKNYKQYHICWYRKKEVLAVIKPQIEQCN